MSSKRTSSPIEKRLKRTEDIPGQSETGRGGRLPSRFWQIDPKYSKHGANYTHHITTWLPPSPWIFRPFPTVLYEGTEDG